MRRLYGELVTKGVDIVNHYQNTIECSNPVSGVLSSLVKNEADCKLQREERRRVSLLCYEVICMTITSEGRVCH